MFLWPNSLRVLKGTGLQQNGTSFIGQELCQTAFIDFFWLILPQPLETARMWIMIIKLRWKEGR